MASRPPLPKFGTLVRSLPSALAIYGFRTLTQMHSPSAENNKHMRVALAVDCNADRLIYTSDAGHALRSGNASAARLHQRPELIFKDAFSKFTWIAVDPTSGNIFAIDDEQNRIVVVNPDRPNQSYTFKKLADRARNGEFVAGGIAVHPGLS